MSNEKLNELRFGLLAENDHLALEVNCRIDDAYALGVEDGKRSAAAPKHVHEWAEWDDGVSKRRFCKACPAKQVAEWTDEAES